MSRWSSDCASLGIAADGIAWHAGGSGAAGRAGQGLLEVATKGDFDASLREAMAAADRAGCRRVHIAVSAAIAPHWTVQPPSGVRSLRELRAFADARCCRLFGGQPHDWVLAGDWNARRAFVCAALPRPVLDAVMRACTERHIRPTLRTTLGIALERRAAAFPDDGWACVRTHRTLAIVRAQHGRVATLRVLLQPAAADFAQAADAAAIALARQAHHEHMEPVQRAAWLQCASAHAGAPAATLHVRGISFEPVPLHTTQAGDHRHEAVCALAMAMLERGPRA